jgi:hypothetical protein
MTIKDVLRELNLQPIGEPYIIPLYSTMTLECVEIYNQLGRVWMVLVLYSGAVSGWDDLLFYSKEPSVLDHLDGYFCSVVNIDGISDLRRRFDQCRDDWDHKFLASVIGL